MPMQLSPELKALLRMKKPEFVDYMCANSTKKELSILYKLLFYRNIDIDDAEQMIVDTFSKEELGENIYRMMHRKTFWNVSNVIECVSLLINTKMWIDSFTSIRRAYKSGQQSKISLLQGAGFVLHSLIVLSNVNSLRTHRNKTRRQRNVNKMLLDLHLQNTAPTRRKNTTKNQPKSKPTSKSKPKTKQSPKKKGKTVSKRK